MKNIHMFGISQNNGVKKHFFRPEKWHGFAPGFYSERHTNLYGRPNHLPFTCRRLGIVISW